MFRLTVLNCVDTTNLQFNDNYLIFDSTVFERKTFPDYSSLRKHILKFYGKIRVDGDRAVIEIPRVFWKDRQCPEHFEFIVDELTETRVKFSSTF